MSSNRYNLVLNHNGVRYTGRFIASTTPSILVFMDLDGGSHRPLGFIRAAS